MINIHPYEPNYFQQVEQQQIESGFSFHTYNGNRNTVTPITIVTL